VVSDPGPAVLSDVPPMGSLQFSVGEAEQALLNLDANKKPGPDKISLSTLKNCAASFSFPLLVFSRLLKTCVFPEKWKLSFVTPIHKTLKRNDVAN
jgi:hypothetical protein